ncbi:MAG: ABC-type multidrug transport system ATPase subunit [Alphaproteobacteria bacterium]|jgi:ABC-type multidrug transport system ATPase subunit
MLTLHNITKSYTKANKTPPIGKQAGVLQGYSANFTSPRSCVVGENGSGKSTLLLVIAGLLSPDAGIIKWQQKTTLCKQRKQMFAIASDSIAIPEFLTAQQVIELNQSTWQLPMPDALIEQFNFGPHIFKTIDALSAGNLKKLQLISVFMRQPSLLLLDEPNIALDQQSVNALWNIIDCYNGKIIVASNEPTLFEAKGFNIEALSKISDLHG